MGGETKAQAKVAERNEGLSPRGRGNQCAVVLQPVPMGSIPAWAGKPHATRTATR